MQRFFLRIPAVAGGFLFLHKTHRFFHQVPHHGLYVPSHVTYFGVLGGFHLHKRCMSQGGNPPGNFCLAYAGGANEKNILGADLLEISGGSCPARQRFRRATATARLASFCPIM